MFAILLLLTMYATLLLAAGARAIRDARAASSS